MKPGAATSCVVAAIDLGSSAVRLSVARIDAHGIVRPFFQHRVPVRLGSDVFAEGGDGALGEQVQYQLVGALQLLMDFASRHGATRVRAVATSAMREAKNAEAVCRRIHKEVGLRLEVLSGAEEGLLSRQALAAALARQGCSVPEALRLYVDLGGGSLELEGGDGALASSLPLGTVRLLAQLPALGRPQARPTRPGEPPALQQLACAVKQKLQAALGADLALLRRPEGAPPWTLIGTGGNLEAMANLLPGGAEEPGRHVNLAGLWPLAERVAPMPLASRISTFGLRPDRADLVLPALLVVHALVQLTGARALWVPGSGLRDGLLAALAKELGNGGDAVQKPKGLR